jgi:hypothetical protein
LDRVPQKEKKIFPTYALIMDSYSHELIMREGEKARLSIVDAYIHTHILHCAAMGESLTPSRPQISDVSFEYAMACFRVLEKMEPKDYPDTKAVLEGWFKMEGLAQGALVRLTLHINLLQLHANEF